MEYEMIPVVLSFQREASSVEQVDKKKIFPPVVLLRSKFQLIYRIQALKVSSADEASGILL